MLAALLLPAALAPPCAAQSTLIDTCIPNGPVYAFASSNDTLYMAGRFDRVGAMASGAARLDRVTGRLVPQGFPQVAGRVDAIVPDGSGGWYIGGNFTAVGGIPRTHVARVLADGSVSPWAPQVSGSGLDTEVFAVLLHGDALYIGGQFTAVGGLTRRYAAAIDTGTGATKEWNPTLPEYSGNRTLALASHGETVYIGGVFKLSASVNRGLYAFDAAIGGTPVWDAAANNPVHFLKVDESTLYVSGVFSSISGAARACAASFDLPGNSLTSWNPSVNGIVHAIVKSGLQVFLGGTFTTVRGASIPYLASVSASSGTPTLLRPRCDGDVYALQLSGDTLFVAGSFYGIAGVARRCLAAINVGSGLVHPWSPSADATVTELVWSGADLIAAGQFTIMNSVYRLNAAAIDLRTGLPTAWDPQIGGEVRAMRRVEDRIYLGGSFSTVGGVSGAGRTNLTNVHRVTGTPASWATTVPGTVYDLIARDGALYLAGSFSGVSGVPRNNLAAVDAATGAVLPWDPAADQTAFALADGEGAIYAGGAFTTVSGVSHPRLAVLDPSTGLPDAWVSPVSFQSVTSLRSVGRFVYVTSSQSVYLTFDSYAAVVLDPATGWSSNTPLDSGILTRGAHGRCFTELGGAVYLGGFFVTAAGRPLTHLAAFDAASGHLSGWYPPVIVDTYRSPTKAWYQKDVVLGMGTCGPYLAFSGSFTAVDGQPRMGFAIIQPDNATAVTASLARSQAFADRVELAWQLGGDVPAGISIERSLDGAAWSRLAGVTPDGTGHVEYLDRDVLPGQHVGYRLAILDGTAVTTAGETWVDVPTALRLALFGTRPNPTSGPLRVWLSLPTAHSATLELIDLAGRSLGARALTGLAPGTHAVELATPSPLAAGVYWLRLRQGGESRIAKVAVVR